MVWSAIAAARAHDPATRVPFFIAGHAVGSVTRAHLSALRRDGLVRAWRDESG